MFELPKEYESMYEHIRLATPELEDYKEYLETTPNSEPASKEQFIDVATYIAARLIPKKLDLTQKEKKILLKYYVQQRIRDLMHALDVTE